MYTYKNLCDDIAAFSAEGLETGCIGKTELGTEIPFVHVGGREKSIIVQGAIHAREHITAELIIKLIRHYKHMSFGDGIYFVPMVNIDGVRLCQEGADFLKDAERRDFVIRVNNGNESDFTEWKANINAVDLNVNFPARWGTGAKNVFTPAAENFVGAYAGSETETRALMDFTRAVCPAATVSYHIRGEEIYWEFFQTGAQRVRDRNIAERLAAETGYAIIDEHASAGGYKDWCVQEFAIPSYTIETGKSIRRFPYPYTDLPEIFDQNKNVPKILLNSVQ